MKKELAEAWVKDLRTPGLKQAHGRLFDGEGHCCLGRLCLLMGAEFKPKDETLDFAEFYPYKAGRLLEDNTGTLPATLVLEAGMESRSGTYLEQKSLALDNDKGLTFEEIADIIEENWRNL